MLANLTISERRSVAETPIAAAVAVELAARGHEVLLTTTDPAADLTETPLRNHPLPRADGVAPEQ